MNVLHSLRTTVICGTVVLITACGGGGGPDTITLLQTKFVNAVSASFQSLAGFKALTSTSFQDLFDSGYLDSSITKTTAAANFTQDQTASASADWSAFPFAALSNVAVTNCNAAQVCTMTGTLTNTDADSTTIDFSTLVKIGTDGQMRFYGDQSSSAS